MSEAVQRDGKLGESQARRQLDIGLADDSQKQDVVFVEFRRE